MRKLPCCGSRRVNTSRRRSVEKRNVYGIKLTKGFSPHGEGLSINHDAWSIRVGDFKLIRFPHDVFIPRFIRGYKISNLCYAVDTNQFETSIEEMGSLLSKMDQVTLDFGPKINRGKMKIMTVDRPCNKSVAMIGSYDSRVIVNEAPS
uniref:SFRICE_031708 n=1 Tax=Spodoptera frugiperda TaxID=7108 RepID=A0A2H1WMJ5_SPOFR